MEDLTIIPGVGKQVAENLYEVDGIGGINSVPLLFASKAGGKADGCGNWVNEKPHNNANKIINKS